MPLIVVESRARPQEGHLGFRHLSDAIWVDEFGGAATAGLRLRVGYRTRHHLHGQERWLRIGRARAPRAMVRRTVKRARYRAQAG